MPKIPQLIQGPGRPRRATGFDFGGDEGLTSLGRAVGDVGAVAAALFNAREQANVTRGVQAYARGVNDLTLEFEQDPDFATARERFDEQMQRLFSQFQEEMNTPRSKREFEQRSFAISERSRLGVSDMVRAREIDSVRAQTITAYEGFIDLAGKTTDPDLRSEYLAQADAALKVAVNSGAFNQEQAARMRLAGRREIANGDIREAIREDPADALVRMLDPKDPLVRGLPEEERQIRIDQATAAYQAQLSSANTLRERARKEQDRLEKEQVEAVQRDADDLLAAGDLDQLQVLLNENRDLLPADERREYMERIAEGGGFGGTQSNRAVYGELSDDITRGQEGVSRRVRKAFLTGQIDQADRERLLAHDRDRRFGDADRILERKLKVSEFAIGAYTQRAKSAEAKQVFADWKVSHPDATHAQAIAQARQLIASAVFTSLEDTIAAKLVPTRAVRLPGGAVWFNIEETINLTRDDLDSGLIDQEEYDQQVWMIEQLRTAQERAEAAAEAARAAREAAQQSE